jgi:hypothetical protein
MAEADARGACARLEPTSGVCLPLSSRVEMVARIAPMDRFGATVQCRRNMSGTPGKMVRTLSASLLGLLAFCAGLPAVHAQTPDGALAPPPGPALSDPPPMLLSSPPTSMEDSAPASGERSDEPRRFGAMFDLGVPDGTMLSFVFRPVDIARFHAGAGYNGISPGLRIGAALLPLGWGPSVSLDYGHYFEGDANGLVGLLGGSADEESVLLEEVGYDYLSLRAGMELGGDRFTFFARGGVSWMRTTIHEFAALIEPNGATANGTTTITVKEDPVLNVFVPSLQLGFIVQL